MFVFNFTGYCKREITQVSNVNKILLHLNLLQIHRIQVVFYKPYLKITLASVYQPQEEKQWQAFNDHLTLIPAKVPTSAEIILGSNINANVGI